MATRSRTSIGSDGPATIAGLQYFRTTAACLVMGHNDTVNALGSAYTFLFGFGVGAG